LGASIPAAAHSSKASWVGPISTRSLSAGEPSGLVARRREGSILGFSIA
jgi:hypothetical protein